MRIISILVLAICLWAPMISAQHSVIYGQMLRSGNAAYSKGQYIQAEIEYRKALDMFPESPDASFNLGNALFKQGRYDQAINMFETGIESENSPELKARALYNLGTAHLAREDYPAAAEALRNSLRINPNQEDTRHNLAVAVKKQQAQEQQDSGKQNEEEQQQSSQEEQQDEQDQETEDPAEDAPEDAPPSDQPPSRPMTPEEADQMLRRLEFQEQQVQQQIRQRKQKNRIRGEKDW